MADEDITIGNSQLLWDVSYSECEPHCITLTNSPYADPSHIWVDVKIEVS